MDFSEWITQELDKKGWSRREAARRGDISASILDKVIAHESQPGITFYKGIAKAFEMSLVDVLIKAGEVDPRDLSDENINTRFARLSGSQQRMVLRFIESITQDEEVEKNPPVFTPTPKPRPTS
jgi:transcriptional regulator with XRE-family HTH domain